MKTVLLAAGLGRRMRPLTDACHKCLIEISPGVTILGRILQSLSRRGVDEVVIVTGYRADDVRQYAEQTFPGMNFVFVHNERYAETNNIHSMALAFEAVDFSDGLILIESDLVVDDSVFDVLDSCPHENVALLDRYKPGMDGTVVRMDADAKIVSVIPSDRQPEGFDFSNTFKTLNIYRFSASFTSDVFSRMVKFYAQTVDDNCYYELVLGMLIAIGHADVRGATVREDTWCEVDDPVDLDHARFMSSPAKRRSALDETWGGYWGLGVIDFAFLRNMHFPTPQIVAEMRLQLPELMGCYGSSQAVLDRKIAWFMEVPEERIVAINGASQFFPWAAGEFGDRTVWLQSPTFGEWTRAFPHASTYSDVGDARLHVPHPLPRSGLAVIVNPNNPTGTTIANDEILAECRDNPDTMYLIDESFIRFSGQPSIVEELERNPLGNVVVLQSLSKALGVPGVRIGFVYSTNVDALARFRSSLPVWNMNSIAEKFLELLLKNRPELERSFIQTRSDRDDLRQRITRVPGVRSVWRSGGDFVLIELDMDRPTSSFLADRMLSEHKIYVKEVSAKFGGHGSYWRLAVRHPAEHELLAATMTRLISRL
jgi:histidinol-phosphate/aromatic aminotransferase/cobyric acid decarboxylase-like protein/choline kinase